MLLSTSPLYFLVCRTSLTTEDKIGGSVYLAIASQYGAGIRDGYNAGHYTTNIQGVTQKRGISMGCYFLDTS